MNDHYQTFEMSWSFVIWVGLDTTWRESLREHEHTQLHNSGNVYKYLWEGESLTPSTQNGNLCQIMRQLYKLPGSHLLVF